MTDLDLLAILHDDVSSFSGNPQLDILRLFAEVPYLTTNFGAPNRVGGWTLVMDASGFVRI